MDKLHYYGHVNDSTKNRIEVFSGGTTAGGGGHGGIPPVFFLSQFAQKIIAKS